jgi:hypothetical protein
MDFWKKWIKADGMDRIEMIESLPITKTYASFFFPKLGRADATNLVATSLNVYFEDLADAMNECKND